MAYGLLKLNIIPLFRLKTKKVEGLKNIPENHNFVIAANHNTWLDPIYIVSALTKVIKKKIYFISGNNKFSCFGTIVVDKKNKAKTAKKALKYLEKGRIIFIFVEGRSNPTKMLLEPKTGAARLAIMSRLPVIPLGITGGRGLTNFRAYLWDTLLPRVVKIKIGKPISFEKYYALQENRENLKEASNIIIKEISKLCGKKPPEDISL